MENEVYQTLKSLQYPYLETINRSQISAVGGSNWYKFLGMLHWLVKTNIKLEKCLARFDQSLLLNQNTQDFTMLNQPLKTLDEQDQRQEKYELIVEKLFIDYITESYQSFLKLEDNYEPAMEKLSNGFNKFIHIIETDIKNLQLQNDSIYRNYQKLIEKSEQLKISKQKNDALNNDLTKFQNYINTMQFKSQEWPNKLERMRNEIISKNKQIKVTSDEIESLQKYLKKEKISMEIIEGKNQEKETFLKSLDGITDEIDKLTSSITSKKIESAATFKNMINTIKQYDTIIQSIIDARRDKLNHTSIDGNTFKINLNPELINDIESFNFEDLTIDENNKITHDKLFVDSDFSISRNIKDNILLLNSEIQDIIRDLKAENSQLETTINELKAQINESTSQNEYLEEELAHLKSEFELTRQKDESDLVSQKIEIEKFERKILDSKNEIESKLLKANRLVQATKTKHHEAQRSINEKRESLQRKIIEIIEVATDFKFDIQSLIESKNNDVLAQLKELDIN